MTPIPYVPRMDDAVSVVLLCCFFVTSFLMSRNRTFVLQLAKDFVLHRERNSLFDTPSVSDMRYLMLFVVQTCVLAGICIFLWFCKAQPDLVCHVRPLLLMGIYVGASLVYLFLKWLVYSLIGRIFFDEEKVMLWFSSYSALLYYVGFSLFPATIFFVYFDANPKSLVIIGLIIGLIAKILILYKWIKLFCDKLYGCFYLIVYFCALEIVPCLMLYRGMMLLNDCLIIKF